MFFLARAVFFWSRKEGEAVCGSQQFFSSSFAAEKKDGQIIQVFCSRKEAAISSVFGYFFYKKVFLLIIFRGDFSGEIFINLS